MGDYSKQTWTDDDGSGTTGTLFSKARMDAIEQGIFDATKQVSADVGTALDGTTATTNDKKRVVWRRTSNGSYVASSETYESGSGASLLTVSQDRVNNAIPTTNTLTNGATLQRIIEAYSTGGNPIITQAARLVLEAVRGGRAAVRAEIKAQAAPTDPSMSATILDDLGYSDFTRVTRGTYSTRPTAGTTNQGQFFFATDTKALYYNDDGARWIQLAGPQEASTITTPLTGFGTHYVNYLSSFRYWKDALGYVHATGEINDDGTGLASIAANAVIWDGFPAGYRPVDRKYLKVGGNPGVQSLLINTSGQIRVDDNAANTTRYMNIGHITFPTF